MSREKSDSGGGLQIQTLLISAVSAVAAATVVPMFWEKGTVIATAMTPVIVAIVSEALRRPVAKVSAVAPKVTAVRQRVAVPVRGRPHGSIAEDPHDFDPVVDERVDEPIGGVSADDPFGLRTPARRPWLRIGLVTGLLAFVLGAGVVTASELTIFGGSVSGDRGRTTLFGGGSSSDKTSSKRDEKAAPTATPSSSQKAAPTATATPEATATPTATATATPTPSATAAPGAAATATPTP